MERLVHFDLFGQEFSFYTSATDEEVEEIVNLVRAELDEGGQGMRTSLPSNKMLVLGCLKIAARLVQLQQEFEQFRSRQDESIDKLITKVSSGLD